ncbi:MAG: 50S ribosomal protein L24 [Anaerolineae bacterium]|nr:50S ribosomal protein L24 [Anaerolineae bacterium]
MQKIKKGDNVEVIAGKDLGTQGRVLAVLPKEKRVLVEKVNIVTKHQKPRQQGRTQTQGIQKFEAPIDLSNVMLVCQSCNQATRVGFRFDDEGKKVRFCKKCDATIE